MKRDDLIFELIEKEHQRQLKGIELIASENFVSDQVMQAMGSCLTNKYAEGYPGKRYYGGCEVVDQSEQIAIDRLKQIFGAEWANVQPHSGAQANAAVFLAVLNPGDKFMGLNLAHGGHLSHGSLVNTSGIIYTPCEYNLNQETGRVDYDQMEEVALREKPKMIIGGGSAYSREWDIIDKTLRPNPDITYVKWDCNRYITQPGSSYLQPADQSHLWIDYNRALYRLMDRFAKGFPNVMAMLCAGGSGRVDYGAMPYFHSFWPSDNTDPLGRIKIQWGFSHFFPANTISAHVTRMGKRHLKMAIDVALSGAFGIDLALDKATAEERAQIADAVKLYKERIRPLVMHGELYRLVSPYESPLASLSYVSTDKQKAVVYFYQTKDGNEPRVMLGGLDAQKKYRVEEVSLAKGVTSRFPANGKVFTGAELMEKGLENPLNTQFESAVLILVANN